MESHDACIKMNARSARKVFSSSISLQTYIHVSLLSPPRVFSGGGREKKGAAKQGERGRGGRRADGGGGGGGIPLSKLSNTEREGGKKDEGGWVHLSSSGGTKICVQQQPQVTQFQ